MITIILGTRPEIIKLYPIIKELEKRSIKFTLIHTGQHYSADMDSNFFKELDLKPPNYNLGVREKSHVVMIAKMMLGIEGIFSINRPDFVLVQGDTNSTLSGALVSAKMGIKVGHVEAGLRSYDRQMPEEVNRILVDHISDVLFCPTESQRNICLRESIDKKRLFIVGNTIVDSVLLNSKIKNARLDTRIDNEYFLLTLHRPSNVDSEPTLRQILRAVIAVSEKYQKDIIFPIHPRTRGKMNEFGIKINSSRLKVIDCVGFREMLQLEKNARLILTDSGGIQEEACTLSVPCVTLRENTERPETVMAKANIVSGVNFFGIHKAVDVMMRSRRNWKNPLGNGKSAARIVNIINRMTK